MKTMNFLCGIKYSLRYNLFYRYYRKHLSLKEVHTLYDIYIHVWSKRNTWMRVKSVKSKVVTIKGRRETNRKNKMSMREEKKQERENY